MIGLIQRFVNSSTTPLNELATSMKTEIVNAVNAVKTEATAAKTNTATNNNGNATGTLSQKLTQVLNLIGATNNTGGTTTAGTVYGKLNALLSVMTTTRGGYIDRLANGTYGLEAIKNLINTVNTAGQRIYYAEGTNQTLYTGTAVSQTGAIVTGYNTNIQKALYTINLPEDGVFRIDYNFYWTKPANITITELFANEGLRVITKNLRNYAYNGNTFAANYVLINSLYESQMDDLKNAAAAAKTVTITGTHILYATKGTRLQVLSHFMARNHTGSGNITFGGNSCTVKANRTLVS